MFGLDTFVSLVQIIQVNCVLFEVCQVAFEISSRVYLVIVVVNFDLYKSEIGIEKRKIVNIYHLCLFLFL